MRILQLCHKPPFPPTDGGSIAMNQITQGLLDKGYKVKVFALVPSGMENMLEQIPESYIETTEFESHPIHTKIKPLPALLNLVTGKSYNISRFYNKNAESRLREILQTEEFDIIQMEGLYLTPYLPVIRDHTGTPILFRSHNIEHFIWERLAKSTTNPLKKLYLKILATRLRKYEMKTVHQVDGLVAISPVDLRFFQRNGFSQPAVTIPVGMDEIIQDEGETDVLENSVFHLGRMDWRPNLDGMKWFLDQVWPIVVSKNPMLTFVLAGINIPHHFYQYEGNNVVIAGEVPDARSFLQRHQLMVVPLQSGGGMRVKIIEGMATGKPIVSTSIGAEGIDCTHKENILLADMPDEMANAILHCFDSPDMMLQLGQNARMFAIANHSMPAIIEKLTDFYQTFYASE